MRRPTFFQSYVTLIMFPKASSHSFQFPTALSLPSSSDPLMRLRGGSFVSSTPDVADLAMGAYDWCGNLGAPSALVAGAVVATLYETMQSGDLTLGRDDTRLVALAKKVTRMLLMSAFALETVSIFVTTVTGTMLLSRSGKELVTMAAGLNSDATPLSFLRDNFEFEYLTARITFLQGLLNWLGAIALTHAIPQSGESMATRKMNLFIASSICWCITMMVSFYNGHMNFYENYAAMLLRWCKASWYRFVWHVPVRPTMIISLPLFLISFYWGFKALMDEPAGKDDKVASTMEFVPHKQE